MEIEDKHIQKIQNLCEQPNTQVCVVWMRDNKSGTRTFGEAFDD